MNLLSSLKMPIRIAYFGFVLLAIGYFIINPNVNVFYTFNSNFLSFIADIFISIGELIISNLPLIFMLYLVVKKENSSSPIVMAFIGYFTFLATTALFANQTLEAHAYASNLYLNSIINVMESERMPLELGLLTSFIVAYSTRLSFVLSRDKNNYSIINFFNKDIAGIIYNVILCFILGILVSYGYPFLYGYIQKAILFISKDLFDPLRIGLYTFLERIFALIGLEDIIRYPFWYTSLGGSYSNALTGQSVVGDINIWTYINDYDLTYFGSGRFMTPYYVINMFIIPGYYIGTLLSINDKSEKIKYGFFFFFASILSILMGNPLPAELMMLATSPILLVFYYVFIGIVSGTLVNFEAFLGYETTLKRSATCLIGTFPDYIIKVRNINLHNTIVMILIIGVISLILFAACTFFYYQYFAFDFVHLDENDELLNDIIESSGGLDNIEEISSGLFKIKIYLKNLEKISYEKLNDLPFREIYETRYGLTIETGTICYAVSKRISKMVRLYNKKTNKEA